MLIGSERRLDGVMTSRDLAFEALAHREPSRVPFTLYVPEGLRAKLRERWGPRDQWPCPADDIIRVLWPVVDHDVTETGFKDRFDCRWQRDDGGYVFVDPPLSEPDAGKIPKIDLVPECDVQLLLETRRQNPDRFIFYQFTTTLGERLWNLRGMEEALLDYLAEPAFVHAALDRLMEMHLAALEKLVSLPIDGVTFGDDFGAQRGLMFSRKVFLEFFKPRYAVLYEKVRAGGKVVGHHSCGDNTELLGDFVDIGLDVFHPLQPEAMDIKAAKREFGRDLTFRGGIGTQGAIVFGSADEARAEVREAVRVLSQGGGYFLETAKPLPEETPVENAVAVIEEMFSAMNYRC